MKNAQLTIATRESPLALWQANWVKTRLEQLHPHLAVKLLGLTTQADRLPYISLAEIGGKGLFVKELEEALLDGRADIAVHCMKDMPVDLPPGLCMPVICEREEPWDVFISNAYASLEDLPAMSVVGTSSLRRQSQLLALRPDIEIKALRGNVNTRLAKLDSNEYSAIILASAGIRRLGFQMRIRQILSGDHFLPSAGQGALGIECRAADHEVQALIAMLNDPLTNTCVSAERAMCRQLRAGCQVPVAALAHLHQDNIIMRGMVATVDGKKVLRASQVTKPELAVAAGIVVANELLDQGAEEILQDLRR